MVDKEVNAVDSEHKKNMPDTQRRLWHLLRSKARRSPSPVWLFLLELPQTRFPTGRILWLPLGLGCLVA